MPQPGIEPAICPSQARDPTTTPLSHLCAQRCILHLPHTQPPIASFVYCVRSLSTEGNNTVTVLFQLWNIFQFQFQFPFQLCTHFALNSTVCLMFGMHVVLCTLFYSWIANFCFTVTASATVLHYTRQLSYRKEDRAMYPIYGCSEKFWGSSLRTRLLFQKCVMDFCSDQ